MGLGRAMLVSHQLGSGKGDSAHEEAVGKKSSRETAKNRKYLLELINLCW
jgi:hypothetical protein